VFSRCEPELPPVRQRLDEDTLEPEGCPLLKKFRLALVARRYARLLGPRLARDYGGGGEYTAPQIRAAVRKCWLPARYIKLGYAAFMDEEGFRAAADEGDWPDYADLRALYREWVPVSSYAKPDAPGPMDFWTRSGPGGLPH
jgi:hypothetical protein